MKNSPESFETSVQIDLQKNNDSLQEITRQEDKIVKERIETSLNIDHITEGAPTLLRYLNKEQRRDTIKSFARLVIELEDRIPTYDTIISDDSSGRLISLFLREVINKKKAELEEKPIQTFFVNGGQHNSDETNEAIDEFIHKKTTEVAINKVLLATEYIQSGNSIQQIMKILEKYGLDIDVAALSVEPGFFQQKDSERLTALKNKLIYGTEDKAGLLFHSKPKITGVIRENKTGHSASAHPVRDKTVNQKGINTARQEIKFIAEEISKLILQKKD